MCSQLILQNFEYNLNHKILINHIFFFKKKKKFNENFSLLIITKNIKESIIIIFITANSDFCPENICQNGGTCFVDDSNGRFYCECQKPYTGTICQFTEIQKPCTLNCANNSWCKRDNRLMREICVCKPGRK